MMFATRLLRFIVVDVLAVAGIAKRISINQTRHGKMAVVEQNATGTAHVSSFVLARAASRHVIPNSTPTRKHTASASMPLYETMSTKSGIPNNTLTKTHTASESMPLDKTMSEKSDTKGVNASEIGHLHKSSYSGYYVPWRMKADLHMAIECLHWFLWAVCFLIGIYAVIHQVGNKSSSKPLLKADFIQRTQNSVFPALPVLSFSYPQAEEQFDEIQGLMGDLYKDETLAMLCDQYRHDDAMKQQDVRDIIKEALRAKQAAKS